MKTKTKNHTEANSLENESPLSIVKRLFSLTNKELQYWKRVDTLSFHEIILLFYGVIPERILDCPLGKTVDEAHREFLSYLRVHFPQKEYTNPIPHFIRWLDEENLEDLLERGFPKPDPFDFSSSERNLPASSVVQWMKSKNLPFPIQEPENQKLSQPGQEEDLKRGILAYDMGRFRPEQQGKLLCRVAAASLWKADKTLSLQTIQKQPLFKKAVSMAQEIMGKTNAIDPKTIEDWIRDLNPNYNPKK